MAKNPNAPPASLLTAAEKQWEDGIAQTMRTSWVSALGSFVPVILNAGQAKQMAYIDRLRRLYPDMEPLVAAWRLSKNCKVPFSFLERSQHIVVELEAIANKTIGPRLRQVLVARGVLGTGVNVGTYRRLYQLVRDGIALPLDTQCSAFQTYDRMTVPERADFGENASLDAFYPATMPAATKKSAAQLTSVKNMMRIHNPRMVTLTSGEPIVVWSPVRSSGHPLLYDHPKRMYQEMKKQGGLADWFKANGYPRLW